MGKMNKEKLIESIDKRIDYYYDLAKDPHGIAMAIYIAMVEFKKIVEENK